ncbi:MAG: hypothetical protein ACKOXK_07750 [Chakrabartia sp.]
MKKLAGFAFLSLFMHSAVLASSMAAVDAPGGVDSSSPYFAIGTAVTIPTKEELKAQKQRAQQQAKVQKQAQKLARKQAAKNDRRSAGYLPVLGGLGLALVLAGAAAGGGGGGGSGGGGSDSR